VGVTSYKWQDPLKENGSFFYRLKLVDLDGKVSYSKVIPIFSAAKPGSFYYENSFEQLHIVRTDMKVYSWKIFELTGRTLLSGERVSGSHRIDVSALPKGTYIIQTIDESYNSQTYKFIK
jgi:hypothetical protein